MLQGTGGEVAEGSLLASAEIAAPDNADASASIAVSRVLQCFQGLRCTVRSGAQSGLRRARYETRGHTMRSQFTAAMHTIGRTMRSH